MRARTLPLMLWLAAMAAAAAIIARAQYSADLSAFLPARPDSTQALLVQLLRDGPTSQLMLLAIEGADADARSALSQQLAQRLRATPVFSVVANGESAGFTQDRELLYQHRYLLSPAVNAERFSAAGLAKAITSAVDEIGPTVGAFGTDLLVHDPTGETEQLLDALDTGSGTQTYHGVWVSPDNGRALLMARTVAAGSDTDGQQTAINLINAAFGELKKPPSARLLISGPGVFAAEARHNIQHEVMRLSVLSTVLIGALLLIIYRSPVLLALGFLPVVSGAVAGVAAVALGFNSVFGLTLGFGVTLIGEAVDYSVYLFVQSAPGADIEHWRQLRWPTVRLGMLTSVCGFAALLPSQFPGLAQLGLYSVAGLVSAALVTRFVLPLLLPATTRPRLPEALIIRFARGLSQLRHLRLALALIGIASLAALLLHRTPLWSESLSALSPLPEREQALDGELRAELGAPDVRYLIIVSAPDAEHALQGAEAAGGRLDVLVSDGRIGGYESPARYLPSQALQEQRRASLPDDATLRRLLASAAPAAGLKAEALEPFISDLSRARSAPAVQLSDLKGTSLAAGVDALMVPLGSGWSALLPLRSAPGGAQAPQIDAHEIAGRMAGIDMPGTTSTVLDLKSGSDGLYRQYLSGAIRLSCIGLAAISALLLLVLRSPIRTARVLLPLALAALAVTAILALAGRQMTIMHLIGLLLIFAVGSNYALFFDRQSAHGESNDTHVLASLLLANLTTVIGFGVLASSSVAVLSALGSTVAPGALLALLFSAVLVPQRGASADRR